MARRGKMLSTLRLERNHSRHHDFKEFDSVRGRRVMPFDEVGMFSAKHLEIYPQTVEENQTVLGNVA